MEDKPYRPGNGTEGDIFYSEWCALCHHDLNDRCEILTRTFIYDLRDPEYPTEWVTRKGHPTCTAFADRGKPLPKQRCAQTLDLFGATPTQPSNPEPEEPTHGRA